MTYTRHINDIHCTAIVTLMSVRIMPGPRDCSHNAPVHPGCHRVLLMNGSLICLHRQFTLQNRAHDSICTFVTKCNFQFSVCYIDRAPSSCFIRMTKVTISIGVNLTTTCPDYIRFFFVFLITH